MDWITIKGAREHNLKNVDAKIPKNQLVVITGLSGSGKSTLALDTIFAEGQRRYLESVSTYARQFLGELKRPDVEHIDGLSPAIAIEQKTVSHNPRSTVGTITEIYDYMRVLYARIGRPFCPECHIELERSSIDEIIDTIYKNFDEDARIYAFAPLAKEKKGEFKKEIESIKLAGFKKAEIDGKIVDLDEITSLAKTVRHTINILIDRMKLKQENFQRLFEAVEMSLKEGNGFVEIREVDENEKTIKSKTFSEMLSCPQCGFSFPEITPKLFSFNAPYGACPECHGLGFKMEIEPTYFMDKTKTIDDGGFFGAGLGSMTLGMIKEIAKHFDEDPEKNIGEFKEETIHAILYGTKEKIKFSGTSASGTVYTFNRGFEGLINTYERRYKETDSPEVREWYESNVMVQKECQECHGMRLRKEPLNVKISDINIAQLTDMPIERVQKFLDNIQLSEFQQQVVEELLMEIKKRIGFLVDVGLGYISLARTANTLSGGESQRVRLATQIGSGLTGVTYVLDEPTIGLHQRDNDRLIGTLNKLKNLGNTVIVVEHDEDVIRSSDYIVDLGPGAGINGGYILYEGPTSELEKNPGESLTGQYLAGIRKIEITDKKRVENNNKIRITGASQNNLKNVSVDIPLGKFVVVTGVSGSGKSSLIMDTLYPAMLVEKRNAKMRPGKYEKIEGLEHIDNIISIDQSPIGRTPRSNPATYTGMFDMIRDIYATTPEAKMRGYDKGRFSFNVKGGRCENCGGYGMIKIEMQFLQDVYVTCDVCKGKRYNKETLRVSYKNKNISDVLDMSVEEGVDFFKNISSISKICNILQDVGLGYIKFGQPATTLSGGEAQRIKLTSELRKRDTGRTLYILDEPTTGLHFEDVKKLISVLNLLVEKGNTVLIIEHNLDVIKNADYIIDLGPEGGDKGGMINAAGTPEEIAKTKTHTGYYLKKMLKNK